MPNPNTPFDDILAAHNIPVFEFVKIKDQHWVLRTHDPISDDLKQTLRRVVPMSWKLEFELMQQPLPGMEEPKAEEPSQVNHPAHYNTGKIEVIEFLEDQQLEPHEWNTVKYVCRAKHKGTRVQDLQKAVWYLQRKIELLKAEEEQREPARPNAMNPRIPVGTAMKICPHGCAAPARIEVGS